MISRMMGVVGRFGVYLVLLAVFGLIYAGVVLALAYIYAYASVIIPEPTTEQQLSGLVMAVPGVVVGGILFYLWASWRERRGQS